MLDTENRDDDSPKKPIRYRINVLGNSGEFTGTPNSRLDELAAPFENPGDQDSESNPPKYSEAEFTLAKVSPTYQTDWDSGALQKAATQADDDETSYSAESLDLVAPPYDLRFLSDLNTVSVTRRSCIDAKAANVAGLGYRIKRVDPLADETDEDNVSEQIRLALERWAARGGQAFSELVRQVKYDEESNGNGYIEVSRNKKGEIDGLYHIPSHTVRIKKDRSGFVQVTRNNTRRVPFYNFGDKFELKENGTFEILPDRDENINELIHFKIYSPRSVYYGVPVDIAAIPTIIGDENAREHNNKFFRFAATPELALIFEVDSPAIPTLHGDQPIKVEIDKNTKRDIEEHFRRNLAAKTFEPAIFHLPPGVKMRVEKLSSEQKDSGWTTFREKNKSEILEAHRTPPVIVGSADTNYATAAVEKAIYLEQTIAPEQERYEQRLMSLLWPEMVMVEPYSPPAEIAEDGETSIKAPKDISPEDGTGVDPNIWRLDFKEMSVADKSVDAQVHNIYATLGALTINEIRMQLGMKPLPDGDKPPQMKSGAEGNAQAQNATMGQAAAGNPEIPHVGNLPPGSGTAKMDITGLGDGRGPNGMVTPKMPRRPGDGGGFNAANMLSVGHPMFKSEDDEFIKISKEEYRQLLQNDPSDDSKED